MGELGQQTADFSSLVKHAAEESFLSLKELVEKSRSAAGVDDQSDADKKVGLLKYLNKTRQRMLRLNVLAKWCQQVPLIQYCQQLQSTLSSHDVCFTQAADSLFFMHEGLQQARAPIYDVPSAIEVLLTGSYQRLPKCLEDIGTQSTLTEDKQKPALRKLDMLLRSKLLEVSLPKEISQVKVTDGTTLLRVNGEFKVLVTLGYRGHLSLWRILHLELLVGERSGPVKLEATRRHVLGDDLERRMAMADNPFVILYSILHELCVALVMDTVIRQVQALRLGRWKDAIRFELISEGGSGSTLLNQDGETDSAGLRTPGVKVIYWLDLEKNSTASDTATCPFIRIEPGPDLQIRCVHSTFLIDPLTGREAEISLDQSCIDVEKVLLRAICCHRYTRLLEIQKELERNAQICRVTGDLLLHSPVQEPEIDHSKKESRSDEKECEAQEVLRVRAYGSSFFTLGINIRSGRFQLRMSQNVLPPSTLTDCEESLNQGSTSAAEVFVNLRSKSILHLFASIGKFLGLEVHEHGLAAAKVPKHLVNNLAMLLMSFPDCGSSYYLLLQVDKDFKPLLKLLESQSGQSGIDHNAKDSTNLVRMKQIDIRQMQLFEDELHLNLMGNVMSNYFLPGARDRSHISEHGFLSDLSLESSMQPIGAPPSSFSSIVDEVFQLEKGVSASSFSLQNSSLHSHFGSVPTNLVNVTTGTPFSKWEGGIQVSQMGNDGKRGGPALYNGSPYLSSNLKGPTQSNAFSSVATGLGRTANLKKLTASKSEQDLSSLRSPHSVEVGPEMDEGNLGLLNDSKDGLISSRLLSLPGQPSSQFLAQNLKTNGLRSSSTGALAGTLRVAGSSSLPTTPVSLPLGDTAASHAGVESSKTERNPRKRKVSDILSSIPSLQATKVVFSKRSHSAVPDQFVQHGSKTLMASELTCRKEQYNYGNLVAEANKGKVPSSIYVSALLNVVRHCSLCIKHARLTSQMDALDIQYGEEVGLRSSSSNIWFRLPFARGDSWQHICLRLGRPGSMSWDVKINDQHFRDLWELQKGSSSTNWGSGVRIANTSDIDSHIRYDSDGVVLSYQSVEADSMKKLVADIQRLSDAKMFSLGMRKLLGVRTDEKSDENGMNSDIRVPAAGKGTVEVADKLLEQLRRAFKIEAVGLTSFWFSFGSGVLARFIVEWESGREGCTMHVSPDQLWPHTKFLEEFINGGEVESLLDCIRLTAGPLHALVAATRPARGGPIPGLPGVSATVNSLPKTAGYAQAQGLLPSNSASGVSQIISSPFGNGVTSPTAAPLGNHSIQNAAMLAAANRGGPGIVASSLLPIDVSVVLRGPYWIRIIYRKHFAVDMRCFAGDQVWLQPATPPKGGPSVGGSLPCPQFRPFIMEHVAQELNVLDPGFPGSQQMVGFGNSNPSVSPASQLSHVNGNRVNLPSSAALNRAATQVAALSRAGNTHGSSSMAVVGSGLPIRRSPGGGVPSHVRGELNTAIIGLGDDGGYGGGWVPLVALKKVLRGILKYLGVLWLFAQLPDLLKQILGSILKENEGALLNLDQEQPALRFFVGGYVFAVSVHRVQLLLQVLSVKRFHHQQQQQQQPNSTAAQEELTQSEIGEICDYFSRRVASEPYDASRVASFITLLTLPISVLREFLKLIAWKKGLSQAQGGEIPPGQKPRIELCLENHSGLNGDDKPDRPSVAKSNIHYDRSHNSVDFALTLVLDAAHIPHINAAGGAAWLPYCVSVRLRYSFGESNTVTFLGMEGSHGGRACWPRADEWEKCKQRVARTVEVNGSSTGEATQGKLRMVADSAQRALTSCLQGLRDGGVTATSGVP